MKQVLANLVINKQFHTFGGKNFSLSAISFVFGI